ncbi:alpha/beta fold hydrolase [Gordonia sp. CPCC 206044]|uniref:alpha/beta hydrolase n=1 Tax=Gordonia sp. CPCC 206044 TaxID=3140793 RepID=UPI003AF3AD9D
MTAEPWAVPEPVRDPVVAARTVVVNGIAMSALVASVHDPRAVIVAIHGGAARAAYFDCPGHPEYSLLRLGASLGFTVIALDRPGYGASADHAAALVSPQSRVDATYAAIDALLRDDERGARVFLWAHSIGCELAVRTAADERGGELLGVELAGTGVEHQPLARQILGTHEGNAAPAGVRKLLWEPAVLYPQSIIGGAAFASPTPPFEGSAIRSWPTDFPRLAPNVAVPVHFSAAQYEHVWRRDADGLDTVAKLFDSAPRVEVSTIAGAGHNLSIGHAAVAYHLRIMAFIEECLVLRSFPELASEGTETNS